MVADILDSQGWDAWFVGANTPTRDLLLLIDEKKPDIVGLSVSIYFNMAPLMKMMEIIHSHYPDLELLVGGQAFRWGGGRGAQDISKYHLHSVTEGFDPKRFRRRAGHDP